MEPMTAEDKEMTRALAEALSLPNMKEIAGFIFVRRPGEQGRSEYRIWNPVSNIADAWMIVEKLGSLHLNRCDDQAEWEAGFCSAGREATAHAPSAERAICYAGFAALRRSPAQMAGEAA